MVKQTSFRPIVTAVGSTAMGFFRERDWAQLQMNISLAVRIDGQGAG